MKDALSYVALSGVLITLDLSKGIMKIGDKAFFNCTTLKSVEMPVVFSIGESVFEGCISLESVTLRESLKEIGEFSFANCTSLKPIEIPETVTGIGKASL